MGIDVRGSHGCACRVDMWFPWMAYVRGSHGCVCRVDTWFPWMAYERPMDDALMK